MKKNDVSLIKRLKKCEKNANSHYLFLLKNGEIKEHFNDVCYARFYSLHSPIIKARLFINQNLRNDFKSKEKKRMLFRWFDWVVNESSWKDAFISKNRNYYLKKGLSLNCNEPLVYLVGAATTLREGWEYPTQLELWDKLVKEGVEPHLAHIFSSCCSEINKSNYRWVNNSIKGGHGSISINWDAVAYREKKFLNGVYYLPSNIDSKSYRGINSLYSGKKDIKHCAVTKVMQIKTSFKQDLYPIIQLPETIIKLKEEIQNVK